MALLDEDKLQGRIYEILDLLRKQTQCCRVASTEYAASSVTGGDVFVLIFETGTIEVRDLGPNGAVLKPSEYGILTKPV